VQSASNRRIKAASGTAWAFGRDHVTEMTSRPRGSLSALCGFCHTEVSALELPYSDGEHMQTRAYRGRADVQADEPRPCRRCMAAMVAVSLSVDVTVYITHRSQAIRSLCIDSSPDVRAHGDTHGSLRRFCARPLTSPSPQCSGYAGYTQIVLTRCKQKPFVAVIVIASHDSRGASTREGSTARSHQLTTGFFCAATSGIPMRASSTN
jgi:hypothetical protein